MPDASITINIGADSDPKLVALIMSLLAAVQSNPGAAVFVTTEYLTRDDFQQYVLEAEYVAGDDNAAQKAKAKATRGWSELIQAYRQGHITHDLALLCSTCHRDVDHCRDPFMFNPATPQTGSARGLRHIKVHANWQISKQAILGLTARELQSINVAHGQRWLKYARHLKSALDS